MLLDVVKQHGRVGLGGEGILRTHGRASEARHVIHEAIDQGITHFDSAVSMRTARSIMARYGRSSQRRDLGSFRRASQPVGRGKGP